MKIPCGNVVLNDPFQIFFDFFFRTSSETGDDSKIQQMQLSQVNIYYLTVISNLMYKSKCNKGLTKGKLCSWAVSVTTYKKGEREGGLKTYANKLCIPWPDSSFVLEHTCCRQNCSCFKRTIKANKGVEEFDFQVIQSKVILTIIYYLHI